MLFHHAPKLGHKTALSSQTEAILSQAMLQDNTNHFFFQTKKPKDILIANLIMEFNTTNLKVSSKNKKTTQNMQISLR